MSYGNIDLEDFEYMIVYSEPDKPEMKNTWTLPEASFQVNYKSMVKRGCRIHNVYRRVSEKDLFELINQ